jgi:hypothetical protein
MERSPILVDQNQYCENGYTTKSNLHIQHNPYQNSKNIHHRHRKINPKVHMETQKTSNIQSNSEQKVPCWKYQSLIQTILQRHDNKNNIVLVQK